MDSRSDTHVTVIGLGLMGRALAGAFLKAGHPTTVWNRTAAKADQLVAEGAHLAPSVGDAVKAGSLTIVCLTDYRAVRELLDADGVDLDGAALVNLTSGDSAEARQAAGWAARRGARYLDGAIMAVPPVIGTAEAVILHSGPRQDFEAHRSVLEVLGTVTHLGADPGLASLYDVAGLAMMWSVLNAWLQGTALVRTAGVDAATYAPFARTIAEGVAGWLPGYADQVDGGSFPAEVSALETDAAAMTHLIKESEAAGVNAELPKLFKAMADRAIAAGHGAEQYPVLIEEFGRPARD
ncbi:NAD(P)-dependent oxidoreductase [Actinomadura bangladeshensis]|uniref:NAD(P)-dependent oxidoreductase n=1 Tax=Actinomadura bangladeshensis TaxID=453573 RepID=A0A4R4NWM5_9ACTN|nr:NAD(P)-binding domain-containing protein [Actinomadura bangladeshensis]TDC12543.1 NAD(P)-dependent oxidoreductase [Actinomadura bangladeshensis]